MVDRPWERGGGRGTGGGGGGARPGTPHTARPRRQRHHNNRVRRASEIRSKGACQAWRRPQSVAPTRPPSGRTAPRSAVNAPTRPTPRAPASPRTTPRTYRLARLAGAVWYAHGRPSGRVRRQRHAAASADGERPKQENRSAEEARSLRDKNNDGSLARQQASSGIEGRTPTGRRPSRLGTGRDPPRHHSPHQHPRGVCTGGVCPPPGPHRATHDRAGVKHPPDAVR